ncbi:MAG: hypothetical protein AAF226_08295 [Verrucomicrobiota bacterium]
MAHFWDILINLEGDYSQDEREAAIVSSRSMVHFIERSIVGLNFKADFYRLIIECSKEPVKEEHEFWLQKDPDIATVSIEVELGDFLKTESAMHDAFEKVIREGFQAASKYVSLPVDEVNDALDEFIEGGYKSRWIQADKTWKRKKTRAVVECDHRVESFDISQKIFVEDELIYKEQIVSEMPRERLFHYYLGNLIMRGNTIFYEKGKSPITAYDLATRQMTIH